MLKDDDEKEVKNVKTKQNKTSYFVFLPRSFVSIEKSRFLQIREEKSKEENFRIKR